MIRLAKAESSTGRLLAWKPRDGVRFLDFDQSGALEAESLGRFPRNTDATINWSGVDEQLLIAAADCDSVNLSELVLHYARDAPRIIFFWSSLAVPSVELGVDSLQVYISSIIEGMPEFWVYLIAKGLIIENSFEGAISVARIPGFKQ